MLASRFSFYVRFCLMGNVMAHRVQQLWLLNK